MTTQELSQAEITVNADANLDLETFQFRFKKNKLGHKRPNLELRLPVPSNEGIVEILKRGGAGLQLLRDAMYSTIKSVASDIVSDDESTSQEKFPVGCVLWDAIANMPKQERASISAETWESFAADYLATMPSVTGKTEEQVGLAVQLYLKKFSQVKTDKPILAKLKEQLALYSDTANAEQFSDVLELLVRRVDTYLNAEETIILAESL